jgi:hypothetical protein
LTLFNRYAGTNLDIKLASLDTLDAIKLKPARVCPLICEHGFKPDGDHCSKIVCAEGSFLNDDNECEKRRTRTPTAKRDEPQPTGRANARPMTGSGRAPTARRDEDVRPDRLVRERPRPEAKPQASGQIVCDVGGCLPVARGCHIEYKTTAQGGPYEGGGGNVQVCR